MTGVTLTSPGADVSAPVGSYAITAGAAVGTGLANYSITYLTGNLTVTPRDLTITADSRTKSYGQTVTFAGTEFTALGLANSDTVVSVTLTSAGADAAAPVGDYAIVPGGRRRDRPRQLQHHLRQRITDGEEGHSHHRQQQQQDLRGHRDLRRHRVHRYRA